MEGPARRQVDERQNEIGAKNEDMENWLLVQDLEAAEAFYTGVLGMEVISKSPRSVHLDAGAVRLELIRREVFEGDERLECLVCTICPLKSIT